ncbi:hypothetical protein SAMN04487965_2363 [Microbulbifer donghaiensis]|uniref:Membrane-anchored ribosome-binding protein, inhibits growth in stationary phase, ElaB/YqjD/DUF883 family n=1 Tax=Microbulbifer donghaiensis TaxID=494016 RepID=A0A1M5D0L3_9GAMM|nr:hypothetical protein [Microbulbifer donghaiensis]SHF60342.1 hypothetical protein SAMN04487965_2363 [Microbulbifer donghaiensis]
MATAKSPYGNSQEKLKQAYHLAGEAAHDAADNLKARAKTSVETNKKRATDMAERAESSIRQHPVLSVSCAFAVGWVIAKLLK